ncbi:MAG TPA: trypsin-like peptidase domain-containing protein [Roseiflexaceae bacterium]|nr:trypsin-like peptidase domain-containing protein [Roseiflexaceae bacterium]
MTTPLPASDLEARIEAVYQRAGPGVVNITNRSMTYDFFLNPIPREGTGSGFFYDTQGHIVTNYHVVADAEELQVTLADGRSLPAQIVGADPSNDLAVIRVDLPPDTIHTVPVGDSTRLRVGQFVVAIGNPFGLDRTLTVGVVSSLGRVIESPNQRFIGEAIQTDAPINPGNSGGPLLDLSGTAVGVNSAILSPSGANAGIGFAISARTVQRVVPALIKDGRYPHPSLGIRILELTPQRVSILERAGMRVPVEQGLLVAEVTPGGPAARGGIRGASRFVRVGNLDVPVGGDIITAINGRPIATRRDLIVYLETETRVGETVQVTIVRDGQEQVVPVTLGELGSG